MADDQRTVRMFIGSSFENWCVEYMRAASSRFQIEFSVSGVMFS